MKKVLAKKDLLAYGAPALPLAFAGMPLYIHAPDYFTTHWGAPLGLLGFVLLSLRFIDAVQDPLIGRLSDRYNRYRKRIMLLAALILVFAFTALFQPIQSLLIVWFALFMLVATTAFSVLSINLNTIGGLWSSDQHQKTRITGTREGLGLIGLLIAVLMPTVLQQLQPPSQAFFSVSIALAMTMLIAMVAFSSWQKKHEGSIQQAQAIQRLNVWQTLLSLSVSTKGFFGIYLMSLLASSIPAVLVLFFIRDRLDAESYSGLFLGIYFLAGAMGMPIWHKLSREFNKYLAWALSMQLAIVIFIWAFFLSSGDIWQYGLICLFSGLAFGADLSLPPSLLADFVQDEETQAEASLQFGLLAFIAKLSLALASVIAFSGLELVGFKPAQVNEEQALMALSIIYAIIPCLIKTVAMLWVLYVCKTNRKGGYRDKNLNTDSRSSYHA